MRPAVVRVALSLAVAGWMGGLAAPLGLEAPAPSRAEAAEFIADKPFTGKRRLVELNLHMSNYFDYGWQASGGSGFVTYPGYVGPGNFGVYGIGYGIGVGVDLLVPILRNGFIPSLNNAFYVGVFVDPLFNFGAYYGASMSVPIGAYAQWRFYLLKMFASGDLSVFANLGLGVAPVFPNAFGNCKGCSTGVDIFPLFQVGGLLNFTRNVGLRLAFGYPSVTIGVSIGF